MGEQYVRLQNCGGHIVQVPLSDGNLHVDAMNEAFPEMPRLFYVDPEDNVAVRMIQRGGVIIPPINGWSAAEGCFVVTGQEGITGDWRPRTGVCNWPTWSANIAPRIPLLPRPSLSQLMDAIDYRVVCGIEIENWTKYPFGDPQTRLQRGYVSHPATTVQPATRGVMVGRKCGYTATGTSGTVSWLIGGDGRRLVVMWAAPFNFDFYSNRMALGFTEENCRDHGEHWFETMDHSQNADIVLGGNPRINFNRMVCNDRNEEIIVNNDILEMSGTMGTVHKPEIRIIVKPRRWENLAHQLGVAT